MLFARVLDRILHLYTGVQLRKNFLVAPEKRAYYIMIQNHIQGPKVGYGGPLADNGGLSSLMEKSGQWWPLFKWFQLCGLIPGPEAYAAVLGGIFSDLRSHGFDAGEQHVHLGAVGGDRILP